MTPEKDTVPAPGPRQIVINMNRKLGAFLAGAVFLIALVGTTAGACDSTPQQTEQDAANAGVALILKNQPVPIFPRSEYRQEQITVEAMQALGSPTTTFEFPPGANSSSGVKPIKVCASEGLPIPVNASLTNPQQAVGSVAISQMEPNGTYVSPSSLGTHVLCVQKDGSVRLSYWEGDVETESGAAIWSAQDGIVDIGPDQLPICTIAVAQSGDGTGLAAGKRYYHCVKAPQTAAWRDGWLATSLATAA